MSSERTTVATDGSCLGNPGPGGWAWATADGRQAAGGLADTTNNVMELRAVREALAAFPASTPLLLQVDSQYVIKTFTEWIEGWKARGWRTSDKKPVKNRAEIEPIDALLRGRDVRWEHVRGHAGHPRNERVDLLARTAATAARSGAWADAHRGNTASGEVRDGFTSTTSRGSARGSPTTTGTEPGTVTPARSPGATRPTPTRGAAAGAPPGRASATTTPDRASARSTSRTSWRTASTSPGRGC